MFSKRQILWICGIFPKPEVCRGNKTETRIIGVYTPQYAEYSGEFFSALIEFSFLTVIKMQLNYSHYDPLVRSPALLVLAP